MACEVPTLKSILTQVLAASDEHCNQPQKLLEVASSSPTHKNHKKSLLQIWLWHW